MLKAPRQRSYSTKQARKTQPKETKFTTPTPRTKKLNQELPKDSEVSFSVHDGRAFTESKSDPELVSQVNKKKKFKLSFIDEKKRKDTKSKFYQCASG